MHKDQTLHGQNKVLNKWQRLARTKNGPLQQSFQSHVQGNCSLCRWYIRAQQQNLALDQQLHTTMNASAMGSSLNTQRQILTGLPERP